MACDTDLSSGTIALEDKISEKYDPGPALNTAAGVPLKIRNEHFKVPHQNLQNTLMEHCVLVSHITPNTSLAPDNVNSNTFMLKLNDHQVVQSKLKRRRYSQYKVPVPGTVLSRVPQTSKLPLTNRDCVKSVNSTANIHNPGDRTGKAGSGSGTICLRTFHNSEHVHMNSQCGNRTALTEGRPPPPLSGNECGSHFRDDHTGDSVVINSGVKTDELQKTQRHGDSETRAASSMPHQQQPVRKQGADQLVLEPVEQTADGDHLGRVGLPQMDIAQRNETNEVPWQEEVLKPYCDCQISSFTDDMARACTISFQGFPVRLPHVGSVLIQEHQLVTFVRNGKIYVSVSELKSKNMVHNFTKFSSLLRSQSRLLPMARTEVEFLKQKGRVKDSRNARLVSLDDLRWIYRTQAALQQDSFNTAISQCPWYSLTLGHSCRKVPMLNPTQDYVCPLCLRVEQRPIEATTQRYECDLCYQANESPSVPQSQMPDVNNYTNKTQKVEQTSFVVREDGKLQTVIMGHIKVGEKNVAAFCKGEVTYVSCRHLLVHLYQFPWENFVSLVKSLDLCFMKAPVMVCHFFQKLAYPQELVNGRVWCSVQNLRCIACFSVGQMNNTQYLEKNKILALIAQGKYVEEFPYDARGGETEKSLTEPKRVLPSHEYQVHNSKISTTNSSANKVRTAPPGKTVVKVDAARGQILVCRDGKTVGNLCLPQTTGQTSMRVHDQRGLRLDASDGQRVVGSSVKIVGNLCQTQTVAQKRTRTDDQTGLNVKSSVGQTLVGGGDVANVGNLSQTQTVAQNKTKQMCQCVNFDGSGQIMIVGNTTTSTRPSDPVPGIQCVSGLTQSNPVERSPTVPPNSVFYGERSQIPGGNYFVKENVNFTDYKSESGLVFRVMKQPTASQNQIDILSIAAEEIREVASKSEYTSDIDNSGFSNTNDSSCHQGYQSTSFEQCSNLQQLRSEQTTQPQSVPGLDAVTTNVGTVCKDIKTVVPTPALSDNNPSRPESDLSDGPDKLLSMPVDFFQDSPIGSPRRKCFLSPNKMHEVTKPGGDVVVFQSDDGEHYECTALGPINELKDCLLVVSPEKAEKEKPKTISPGSACSQKSVDSVRLEGKSESCIVGPGPTMSLNRSQSSGVCGEDNSEPLTAEGVKNMKSKTEQASQVTSLVVEEYKPDTTGVLEAQGTCVNVSQSTETNEAGPSSMSPIKSVDTPFSTPTRLSVSSPNKSPVIAIIFKKLVTGCNLDKSNSPSSLSVLASVAEAIDEDGDGKGAGTDGGSCKVKSVTADGRSNIANDEATDADAKESSPLLPETQSNANSSISTEDEDMGSDSKEDSSPILPETQINSHIFPEDESSFCDTEETSPLLQETESDIFTEHEVSVGDAEEDSPLLRSKCKNTIISDEDEAMGSDIFESACSDGSPARTDPQANNDTGSGGSSHTVMPDPGDLKDPNRCNHPKMCNQDDELAKCHSDKSSHSDCCRACSHDERLSTSDTDHSCSSGRPHGGDSRSPGSSSSSIEHDIEICTELDLQLKSLNPNQTVEKFPSVPEEQRECSEDEGKCCAQMEDAQMSTEEILETDLLHHKDSQERGLFLHQESEQRNLSHLHQGPEDKAAELGLDARRNVDTDLVMVDFCYQLQTSEGIEETNSGNSKCFQGETEGTDLYHGGSVEPYAAVDVSSVEPSNAVDVSSMVSENAVEKKSKKRKRSQSIHKRVKRKKAIMSEMECMTTELSVTSSRPSSKAPSKNVTVAAESPEFSVCDNNQSVPVEGAMFPETDKFPKFSETDNHQHIPVEQFSTGGKYDHISAETVSPSECATKEHIAGDRSEAEKEGLTEHAVEGMKHVLEKVQVDGLVVADNRLQFKLKLHPSLHTHFKGEPQKKLVERLSRLVKIGYILQQRRQTADGDEQMSTSMES